MVVKSYSNKPMVYTIKEKMWWFKFKFEICSNQIIKL